jgi:two-component system, LytTR family, sensor kinase
MAYRWFIRYKLYHIPFWLLYHYTWWIVTVGNPLTVTNSLLSPYAIKFLFYVFFQAAGVYFNLYFLLPRLLEKGKITAYVLSVLATIVVMAVCIVTGYYASAWLTGQDFQALYGVDPNRIFYFLQVNTLPSSAASTTLALSVKLAKKWFESRRRQEVLEKEKLATELNFLRHQFNPHFLFNTINSIFFLIRKDPDTASDALAKFSGLLRYQLYECSDERIPLSREHEYLHQFIELEKLRQGNELTVKASLYDSAPGNWLIAPFLLMPFVENAFKHVSREPGQVNWIHIQSQMENNFRDR